MAVSEDLLIHRARRAYERGRLEAGLRTAAWVAPMVAVSLVTCGHPAATLLTGTALVTLVTLLVARGGEGSRGVRRGLVAGIAPLLLPVAVHMIGHSCHGDGPCLLFPTTCIGGGVLAGLGLCLLAPGRLPRGLGGLAAAFATAFLAGSLGCVLLGLGGVAGMIAGMTVGATPLLWVPRPHGP
jgi:hypothetical protein